MIIVNNAPPLEVEDVEAPPPNSYTFGLMLTGVDGSLWDLNAGPVTMLPDAQIFAAPDVDHWWNASPQINGSRWHGSRTPQQDHVLPVFVSTDDWDSWRTVDAAWWRAVHPSGEFRLTCSAPDASARALGLRFVAGGDVGTNPLDQLFAAYALECVAANPFWQGDPISVTFSVAPPVDLFPGPPFSINSSSTTQGATVSNPGDEPAWPRYRVTGPASFWSVGVGAAVVSSASPLAAGESVTVDMDPSQLTILDGNGDSAAENMDDRAFAAIPPGVDVPLNLELDGFGVGSAVTVEFTPLYRRPW